MSNMKEFHRARVLKQMKAEFRKLGGLVIAFEESLEKKGVKRKLHA